MGVLKTSQVWKDCGKEELQPSHPNHNLPDALLPGFDSPEDTQDSEHNYQRCYFITLKPNHATDRTQTNDEEW